LRISKKFKRNPLECVSGCAKLSRIGCEDAKENYQSVQLKKEQKKERPIQNVKLPTKKDCF